MIGGIEETSASFEARSAPRSYPTKCDIGRTSVRRVGGKHAAIATYKCGIASLHPVARIDRRDVGLAARRVAAPELGDAAAVERVPRSCAGQFFAVTIALALIVDQLRFAGQYRRDTIQAVHRQIARVGKLMGAR